MAIMVSTLSSMADIVKDAAHHAVFSDMPKPPQITNLLSQIQQSLEEPLDAVQIAQAYRSSQDLSSKFSNDRCMHLVMLLLHNLLLLRVCMDHGNWSNHLLQQELTNVFNGSFLNLKLPEKELSRLLLAFNKIMTFGKSREEFDKNLGLSGQDVPLGEETPSKKKHPYINLKPTQLDHIFAAFSACAGASLEYRSNNEKKRKPGKKRKRSQKQEACRYGCKQDDVSPIGGLSSPQNDSEHSGKVVEGLSDDCRMLDALEENLQRVQHELSLLKQQAQSVKLDPVSLSSLAAIVKGVDKWLDENIHASTGGIVASTVRHHL